MRTYEEQTGHSVHSSVNQRILDQFVSREVIYCVSVLVSELAAKFEHFPEYSDDILDAFISEPDFEEAAYQEGWRYTIDGFFYKEDENQYYLHIEENSVAVYDVDYPKQCTEGRKIWSYPALTLVEDEQEIDLTNVLELEQYLFEQDIIDRKAEISKEPFEISEAENWQELCEDEDIDADEYRQEILEHWIVTDYFARKLEEKGEKILEDFFGMTIWCRTCSGQAISMDGVVAEIAAEMEILQGQQNDWSK